MMTCILVDAFPYVSYFYLQDGGRRFIRLHGIKSYNLLSSQNEFCHGFFHSWII